MRLNDEICPICWKQLNKVLVSKISKHLPYLPFLTIDIIAQEVVKRR